MRRFSAWLRENRSQVHYEVWIIGNVENHTLDEANDSRIEKGRIAIHPVLTKFFGLGIAGCLISVAIWQFLILRRFLASLQCNKSLSKRDKVYLQRQTFRRLQIHILLGLAGILMLFGIYLPALEYPQVWAIVWFAIIILLCWAMLLAMVDYVSIRLHFGRSEIENRIEKLRIDYEIRKYDQEKIDKVSGTDLSSREENTPEDFNRDSRRP